MTPTDPATVQPPRPDANGHATRPLLDEPTFEECVAHHSRYFDDRATGRITLEGVPEGHHVAYYDGRIRGHDADATALLNRVAEALRVHPARVFVHYPWAW